MARQLITQPTAQQTGAQAFQDVTSGNGEGMTSLGIPANTLKNLFFMQGLKKPSSAGGLSTLFNLVKPTEVSADEKKKAEAKKNGLNIINLLEKRYNEGNFAQGRLGGIKENLKAKIGSNAKLNAYQALRNSVRPMLVKAMGDVGNFSKTEQEWAISNVPDAMNTPEEAALYFKDLREKLQLPENKQLVPDMPSSWQSE